MCHCRIELTCLSETAVFDRWYFEMWPFLSASFVPFRRVLIALRTHLVYLSTMVYMIFQKATFSQTRMNLTKEICVPPLSPRRVLQVVGAGERACYVWRVDVTDHVPESMTCTFTVQCCPEGLDLTALPCTYTFSLDHIQVRDQPRMLMSDVKITFIWRRGSVPFGR